MKPDIEFPPVLGIEAVQTSDDVVLFQKQNFLSKHGQTQGCGQTRKTSTNYDDIVDLVFVSRGTFSR